MQGMMYAVILAATLASYLTSPDIHVLPGPFRFLPEILSAVVAVYVIATGIRQRFYLVSPKYWLVFGGLSIVLVCGIIANAVGPGPVVSGIRYYLRPIPLFLLPAVYDFKDSQLRALLRLLLGICIIQAPIALYQRHAIMAIGRYTAADLVYGSLMYSGVLSTFLICALCFLGAAMLRDRFSKLWFGILLVLFVIPMSINETKVTVFFLPAALLITFIVGAPRHSRVKTAIAAVALLVVGGSIFVPLFDYYQSKNSQIPFKIGDFLTKKGELQAYLAPGAGVGSHKEAGRVDALVVPLQQLSRDPVTLAFGLGLGNVSRSSLGANFVGSYYGIYGSYSTESSASDFLLETGVLGLSLILLLHWMIFRDAIVVARYDQGLLGVIALGSIGAIVIVTVCIFYITVHVSESIAYMFWFFGGVIAARRERLAIDTAKSLRTRPLSKNMVLQKTNPS